MSVNGTSFGFSDIFNESQDLQYFSQIIQGTANEIIITPQPTYLQFSTPQRIDPLCAFQCNSIQVQSLAGPAIATVDAKGNIGAGGTGIINSLLSTDNVGDIKGTTILAVGANGINNTMVYNGATTTLTSTVQGQQNLAVGGNVQWGACTASALSVSGTSSFGGTINAVGAIFSGTVNANLVTSTSIQCGTGGILSTGTISCGTNSATCGALSCGAIVSTGTFNNGTNAMTTGSLSSGAIVSTGTFNNGTNAMTTGSLSSGAINAGVNSITAGAGNFSSMKVSGLVGPAYVTVDSKGNLVTDGSEVSSTLVSAGTSSQLYGVTISNANGCNTSFSAGATTGTLTMTMTQNLGTGGTPSFSGLTLTSNMTMGANSISSCGAIYALTGTASVLIGNSAGAAFAGSDNDVFVGYQAGNAVTSGVDNTLVGCQAGLQITTGHDNTHVGALAGWHASGNQNTYLGSGAGLIGTGDRNTAIGLSALNQLTSGGSNCAMGYAVAGTITSGTKNVVIGVSADVSAGAAVNRICIGASANNATDNTAMIGNSSITDISPGTSCTLGATNGFNKIYVATGSSNIQIQSAQTSSATTCTIPDCASADKFIVGGIYGRRWNAFHCESTVVTGTGIGAGFTANTPLGNYWGQTTAALNDEFSLSFSLYAGTYTLFMVGITNNNHGIGTWSLDGNSLGTIDYYSASLVPNSTHSISLGAITTGYHKLNCKMASKNASSSNYFALLSILWIKPASD